MSETGSTATSADEARDTTAPGDTLEEDGTGALWSLGTTSVEPTTNGHADTHPEHGHADTHPASSHADAHQGNAPATNGQAHAPGSHTEDFTSTAQRQTGKKRQPFQPVRAIPYDKNGNKIAGWGRRIAAFAIDWGFLFAIELAILLIFGFAGVGKIGTYVDLAIAISYFTFSIGGPHGQTVGMHLTGIAVIDEETGDTPSYPRALLRFFLVSTFMSMVIPLPVMFYFALFDDKREMVHDKAVGTVVIEVAYEAAPTPERAPARTLPAAVPANPGASERAPRPARTSASAHAPLDPILEAARKYGTRIAIAVAAIALIALVASIVTISVSRANAEAHSPARAATAYLEALSTRDVPALEASSGMITPTEVPPGVNVLLSAADIKRELAQAGNAIGRVSDVVVQSTHTTKAGTATVTLSYHADNQVHTATYDLITSDKSPSGWVVQITPSRLDVTVPTGDSAVTLDGMPLRLAGQVAHVYLYPSVATVQVPASAIWQAASTSVDTRNQDPGGNPQQVSLPDRLLPAASASAIQAVTTQINACLAATSLAPANCPNADVPATAGQGDSYSGIAWSGLGQPTAGMTVSVDPNSGAVSVSGSMTDEVTYTDTASPTSFFGSVSQQQTDGPTSVWFTYPLTWSGRGWTLGTVSASNNPPQAQASSSST